MAGIRWVQILLGGLLAEVVILVVLLPIAFLTGYDPAAGPGSSPALVWLVPPACLVATFLVGWWTARRVGSRFLLHGTLVGVAAALLYAALTLNQALPLAYIVSHFLKVIGGAGGGLVAGRASGAIGRPVAGAGERARMG